MMPAFLGTAQVVTYANDARRCFCQLRLQSGERILISIAAQPLPSVKILRLKMCGLIPGPTVWQYDTHMAGGYEAYLQNLVTMFAGSSSLQSPLDSICTAVADCASVDEVLHELLRRERMLHELKMKETPHEILQGVLAELTRLSDGILLRSKLQNVYGKHPNELADWALLSREDRIKLLEEMKKKSNASNSIIYQSCYSKYSAEFYVDRIDALIALTVREKLKLKVVEEGITVMILCIALAEEIKSLDNSDRQSILPALKEKLKKIEKFGIPFERCFEEILSTCEKLNS